VARYGGEEFAVLLSGTSIADALKIAEEIRLTIKDLQISNPKANPEGVITLSIGVTGTVPQKGLDRSMIIKTADFALYKAKSEGRNRTICLKMD
jgi:two-component system chemotaxis family response regulator WspR